MSYPYSRRPRSAARTPSSRIPLRSCVVQLSKKSDSMRSSILLYKVAVNNLLQGDSRRPPSDLIRFGEDLEPEDSATEAEAPFQVTHLELEVSEPDGSVDGMRGIWSEVGSYLMLIERPSLTGGSGIVVPTLHANAEEWIARLACNARKLSPARTCGSAGGKWIAGLGTGGCNAIHPGCGPQRECVPLALRL